MSRLLLRQVGVNLKKKYDNCLDSFWAVIFVETGLYRRSRTIQLFISFLAENLSQA